MRLPVGIVSASVGRLQRKAKAGKFETGGIFAGNRQGFAVLNVDSEVEAFELLGDMADFAVIDTHPLVSFETLGQFFAEHPLN
jgi:hypothetical protein